MVPGDRKSVEPMAARLAPGRAAAQHQSLLHFVGVGRAWGTGHFSYLIDGGGEELLDINDVTDAADDNS